MGSISDSVNPRPVSRVKQQISGDFGTFLDVQTLNVSDRAAIGNAQLLLRVQCPIEMLA